MRVRVLHGIGDLANDITSVARRAPKDMHDVVKHNAHEGNRLAKGFASEQHTMFGDADIEYPPSFTVERIGPLAYEYGADSTIGDGSKSPGYEHGSINSPAHHDHARSADIISVEFPLDVDDMVRSWFW